LIDTLIKTNQLFESTTAWCNVGISCMTYFTSCFMHVCLASKSDAPAQPEEGEEKEEEKEAEPEIKGLFIFNP